MKKKSHYILFFLLPLFGYGQIININDATDPESVMSLPELVENVLIAGDCANVSNFSEQVSGTPVQSTTKSYGFFKRPRNNTSFPFESGVILTSGNAYAAGNDPRPNVQADPNFPNNLPGDADLEAELNNAPTFDATFIKFEFVPTSPDFNFRFLMASEEYDGAFECQYSDGFAFLLRDITSPNYTNLAVLPNGDNVSVTNIHNATNCTPMNPTFFEGYEIGETNYGGRTVVLTASTTVIPNRTYEIKLVVADQGDDAYDSAIFLEAGSFNIGLDLGPDLTIVDGNAPCTGTPHTISTNYPNLSHIWYLDGVEITGETTNILDVSADGTYSVEVVFAAGCTGSDEVAIEFAENPYICLLYTSDAADDVSTV